MKITLFHNVAMTHDDHHAAWDRPRSACPYAPGDPVVPVFEYEITPDPSDAVEIADEAYIVANAPVELMDGRRRELAEAYRARHLRSLSIGDLVQVGDTVLACDRYSWPEVCEPLNIAGTVMHGTSPTPEWQRRLTGETP